LVRFALVVDRDWQGELSEALGLATTTQSRSTAAEIEHRLSRIEALLSADLDRLGEAVLGATATRLDARFQALAARIEALLAPVEAGSPIDGETGSAAAAGPLNFAGLGTPAAAIPRAQIEQLNRRLDEVLQRLDELSRSLAR
jgi:hypothetical protein